MHTLATTNKRPARTDGSWNRLVRRTASSNWARTLQRAEHAAALNISLASPRGGLIQSLSRFQESADHFNRLQPITVTALLTRRPVRLCGSAAQLRAPTRRSPACVSAVMEGKCAAEAATNGNATLFLFSADFSKLPNAPPRHTLPANGDTQPVRWQRHKQSMLTAQTQT